MSFLPTPKGNPICKISFCGHVVPEGAGCPQPRQELLFPGFLWGQAVYVAMPWLPAGPSHQLSLEAKNMAWPTQCGAEGWCSGGCCGSRGEHNAEDFI